MKIVTVSQAKSRLSAYIRSAQQGEQVVIMRGSKPAVVLRPVSEKDLSLNPELTPPALADFEAEITQGRKKGHLVKLGKDATEAVATLRGNTRKQR
jgi:prevent-host-death family protein